MNRHKRPVPARVQFDGMINCAIGHQIGLYFLHPSDIVDFGSVMHE
jgi:hypothetical protein